MKHIVLLKVEKGVDTSLLAQQIKAMANEILGIINIDAGGNVSPEGLGNFNFGFIVEFEDEQARDNYLPNTNHKKVADHITFAIGNNLVNNIVVVDIDEEEK